MSNDRQLNRWTNWAQSMATRHERFMMRRGLLSMTLLEPLRLSLAITQRRESFALSVFPRIQVSVGGILQQIDSTHFHAFIQKIRVQNLSVRGGDRRESNSLRLSVQSNNAVSLRNSTTAVRNSAMAIHNLKELHSILAAQSVLKKFTQSPVARFFARAQSSHHGFVHLEKLLIERDSRTFAERVLREHSRVEQRRGGDVVMRQPNPPAAAVEKRTSLTLEQQLAATRTQPHSWPDKPAEINVDHLAEQVIRKIDHRIMAYRERLGRAS